jgi:riboflavin biosynthesis pyrimidine reductase
LKNLNVGHTHRDYASIRINSGGHMTDGTLTRIFPAPEVDVALEGLYLQHALCAPSASQQRPLVYSNFIASLDGRIAVEHPITGELGVPDSISNQRDWRLYQELAAQADILITSARYLRDLSRGRAQDTLPVSSEPAYADLHDWRKARDMPAQPAVVILSASLEMPIELLCEKLGRPVYVATGAMADADKVGEIESCGARVIIAGKGRQVEGGALVDALAAAGFRSLYSVAGPGVLDTLIRARVVNRFYLTQVHRLLGGASYDSLLEGGYLLPPADFVLNALYYDRGLVNGCGQFFSVYDAVGGDCSVDK